MSKSERLFYFDECVLSNSCIYFMYSGYRSQPSYNVNINKRIKTYVARII